MASQTPKTPSSGVSENTHRTSHPAISGRQIGVATIPYDRPVALMTSGAPLLNPRSCVTCRRRRVRCDKTMPCSNCRRAQSDCMYPAPGRAPRQMQIQTQAHMQTRPAPASGHSEREADLMERLRKLEGLVYEMSGQGAASENDLQVSTKELPKTQDNATGGQSIVEAAQEKVEKDTHNLCFSQVNKQLGRLVLHDGDSTPRYVHSGFFVKLNDELSEIRNEMEILSSQDEENEFEDDTTPEQSPPQNPGQVDHHSFIFGYNSSDADLRGLHPLPAQGSFLWQIFLENIEPLVKVLHIPTMSKLMAQVRRGEHDLRPGDEALVFTIYYAAVVSSEKQEIETNLGGSQAHFISQFRFALEQALAKSNLLNTTDMAVLQAFVIYLTVVKCHDDSKFCWTLTSLCVRMAQALGLYRDGQQLGLPPFEVEMRRRLWWAIVSLDIRSAEEMGSDLIISDKTYDTQLPSNINDTDIDPSFTEMPIPRQGRTDSSICLTRYETTALTRGLFAAVAHMQPVDPKNVEKSLEERERMLVEVYERMEDKFIKNTIREDDPVFWVASLISRIMMAKVGLLVYQPVLFPGTGPEASHEVRSRLWQSCIEIVEYTHILNVDPACRQWRWLFLTYRQWHAIAYMLLELAKRPWGINSERAWEAAQILEYDHPIDGASHSDHTAVWMPIKRLFTRAKRHREAELVRLRADPEAARQLDREDKLKPVLERIGPAPGMETRLSELRLRWRKAFRLGAFSDDAEYQNILPRPEETSTSNGPANSVPPNLQQPQTDPTQLINPLNFDPIAWQQLQAGNPGIEIYFEGGNSDSQNMGGLYPSGNSLGSMSSIASPAVSGVASTHRADNDHQTSGGHLSPWPGSDVFHHTQDPGSLGDMDNIFQTNNLPSAGLDLNMDPGEIDDIDWKNWDEALRSLSRPAMGQPGAAGQGSWGGM
ncbi:unnamed protein product [Fusarium graminearum]|uniref:Zn(2)-C6 fungal-type domain-containing protein n=1 Tax=Gibberella zeae TaxID=5518 RepID=A0A2H3HAP3_GIBZA|nr:hypothetical protein FG05_05350 [Fusarium graminearum]PCD40227.1 hypothetical protein FGRA07_01498 [Fusarium graminearum]CAF3526562.1 unnamed protein product [Fusarium graminearum]CAG1962122.1 unnamed protein product [Fusarium graminearum]CAG2001967.1 unnamed protein product [Fusarium graminearum]